MPAILPGDDESGLNRQARIHLLPLQVTRQAVPLPGRIPQPECRDALRREPPVPEVIPSRFSFVPVIQRLLEILRCLLVDEQEPLAQGGLFLVRSREGDILDRHVVAFGQIPQGLREGRAVVGHPKGENIAALLAAKAVKHLLFAAHGEGGGLLSVEGAQAGVVAAHLFQLHVLADHLDDVGGALHLFHG